MAVGDRRDPYLGYRFLVEVDSLVVGGFSEVSGLAVRMKPRTYEEGGVNTYTHKLPTRYEHPNLVLKQGLTDAHELWDWMQEAVADVPVPTPRSSLRKNVRVLLQDGTGVESWGWEFRDAYPVSWEGPELRADQGTVAVETLELAHRGLSRMEGLP